MTVCPAQRAQRLGGGMGVGFRQFGEAVCRECAEAGGNERFRSGETEKRNNAVRTELLKALGQAFNLKGVGEHGGKTTFSDEFMRRLSDILGPAFKRGDFGIEDGVVASGKPLTQRRIKAICNAALAKAEMPYDGKAYSAKIDSIMGRFSGKRMAPVAVLKVREYALTIRKTTVDRCLEAKKLDDCVETIDAIFRNYCRVEKALLALEN